jgi:hypothetical protein
MIQSLEADVSYLHKIEGARQTIAPAGFAVRTATRKPARGRDRDLLFVAAILHPRSPAASARPAPLENSAVEAEAVELVNVAAKTYFGVPGSVTAALRETGNAVNRALLQWNLHMARQAINAQGSLTLAVLRNTELYLAQAGSATAALVRAGGADQFPAEARDGRPLGISQSADLSFNLTTVQPGEFLVLGNEAWNGPDLASFGELTLDAVADRLADQSGPNACGLIGRFVPSGMVQAPGSQTQASASGLHPLLPAAKAPERRRRRPGRPQSPEPEPAAPPAEPAAADDGLAESPDDHAAPQSEAEAEPPSLATLHLPQAEAAEPALAVPVVETLERARPAPAIPPRRRPDRPILDEADSLQTIARPLPPRPARRRSQASPLASAQTAVQQGLDSLGQRIQQGVSNLLRNMLPEGVLADRNARLPVSLMAGIAIGLPLVIGLVVAVVYVQRGTQQQYTAFLEQARVEVSLARTAPDAVSARPHWTAALEWLGRAETVRPGTAEVATLQGEAVAFLDAMDLTTRLAYAPLLPGGFGSGVTLSNVVVNGSEVYALEPSLSRVLRAVRTETGGYALDEAFDNCVSGSIGQHNLGPIADMIWLAGPSPVGSDTLMVMDAAGTLAFCPPDGSAPLATQLVPPDSGWTSPRSIALYADGLYVLDPAANEIWVFNRPGGQFTERPSRYFTSVSFDLSQAVDFAIANGEVFILFADGRISQCNRGGASGETACAQDVSFTDTRQGHASGPRLDDAQAPFALLYDPPPEPSLYLADSATGGIYQLSLKLVLQRQFRPATDIEAPLAAVGIGNRKELYLAAGDNIYVAERP